MKKMSESEFKKEAFASLKAEYLFVIIPFLLLVFIKWINNSIEDILLTSDWSLASCIIFGQVALKVSQAVAENNNRMHVGSYGYYSTKRLTCPHD